MRLHPLLTRTGIAFVIGTIGSQANAGGIGISTQGESTDTVLVNCVGGGAPALFFQTKVGIQPRFRFRDLEFLWDSLYSGARGYYGFSNSDLDNLNALGIAMADTTGVNPFGAPYSDIRLVHDYFRDHGGIYDADPSHPYGFFAGGNSAANHPPPDRAHVDIYIPTPGRAGSGGQWPSPYYTAKEDSSTLHWGRPGVPDTVYHCNSVQVVGPGVDSVASPTWTRPDHEVSGNFNHEFQHAMDLDGAGLWTELFSSGAEAVAGHHPVAPIVSDAAYTWPLIAFGAGCPGGCTTEARCIGRNYQGWRLFTAYLAYNFRGQDTTAVLPSGPTVGFADDLLYRWAHGSVSNLGSLTGLLGNESCYTCSTAAYFHPGGMPLDNHSRLGLLLHNWRVANYVNDASLAEGQYGYPAQFGFSPAVDVGTWQSLDKNTMGAKCTENDIVAIPPEVTLSRAQSTVELTRVGTRTAGGGASTYPMALQPLGSEYWVVRSDTSLTAGGQDLVVRVTPEGVHNIYYPGLPGACFDLPYSMRRDGRLVASVVGYSQQETAGLPDSLWKHPEWAVLALPPQWVDIDSAAAAVEFVVNDFGGTNKAAVVILSLADGPGRFYTAEGFPEASTGIDSYIEALPYRLTLALRRAPYDSPSPSPISQQGGAPDDRPAWSPSGAELAFEATIPSQSSIQQIYRKPVAGGSAVRVSPNSQAQHSPDWSSRGDWVAFLQDSAGAPAQDLIVVNTMTGEVRLLAGEGIRQASPGFSPNGQQIAYAHQARVATTQGVNVAWQIRCINLDGTNDAGLTTLTDLGPPDDLRWSPDGAHVYFTRHDSAFAVPKGGGSPIPIIGLGNGVASFDPRPGSGVVALEEHGQYIAQQNCEEVLTPVPMPFRRLALRDTTNGDTQARFYRTGVEFFHPRWSPDGTRVAYSADQNTPGDRDLFVGQVSYNHAPQFSSPPRDTVLTLHCAPYTFAFDLNAVDPDGETVTYQAAQLPPGATLIGNHFSWVNPGPPGSDHYVVFRALDGSGGVAAKVAKFSLLPDPARPAAASDVTLETARYTATVTWTAPGDDSLTGQACRFDVRYSTSPITESNFSSLTDTIAAGTPESAGTVHCAELHGLQSCKWYYVALKTCDDAGRWSALSNVGSAKTHCSGYADIFCDGGMYAQGGGGGGWSTENALLEGAPSGLLAADGYQLRAGLEPASGQYVLRLLQTGDGAVALDEVALGVVDHSADVRAFLDRDRMVLGVASPSFQVTDAAGQDVTEALRGGASLPFVGEPGQTLLVRLNESGPAGDALLLEAMAGGPASSPDSSGILIQVPRGGDWVTVAHYRPRRRFDRFLVDSLPSTTVRMVFLAEHPVRFVGRVAKVGAVAPQRLSLAAARHSRLGDASQAVGAAGGGAATLAAGDALMLGFAAPPLATGRARDWALFVRGTRVSGKGALATRAEPASPALPASYALYQNQPNPFAATTTIRFDLPRPETVRLEVFDLSGRRVVILRDAWTPAGRHSLDWNLGDANGAPVRPGAYLYRITAGSFRVHRKLVVLP